MAAVTDVILRIGTQAPGGFASLQSAIQMVSQLTTAIAAQVKELDKFKEAYQATTIQLTKVQAETKGLVDSMTIMTSANKVAEAQLEMTSDEFAAVAKAATAYADATGSDANVETEKLTEALIRGSSRGLKPYGIELKEGQTQAQAFADGLAQVVDRAKDVEIQADTLTDVFEALGNTISTTAGLLWSQTGNVQESPMGWALTQITNYLGKFNRALDITNGKIFNMSYAMATLKAVFGSPGQLQGMMDQAAMDQYVRQGGAPEEWGMSIPGAEQDQSVMTGPTGDLASLAKVPGTRMRGGGRAAPEEMIFSESEVSAFEENDLLSGYAAEGKEIRRGSAFFGSASDVEGIKAVTEARVEQMEVERTFAMDFADAWTASYDQVSAGAFAANAMIALMHDTWEASVKAVILGGGSIKKAMWAAVRDVALAVAIEAGFRAIMETAEGIRIAASSWGANPEAYAHFAAAAAYTAAAIAAGVVAKYAAGKAGGGASNSSQSGAGGRSIHGGGSGGGGMYGTDNRKNETKVIVVLQGDAGKLFNVISAEGERRQTIGYKGAA